MVGGHISSTSGVGDKNYPGKLTKRVIFTCIVAAFGGLIFGYDLGISGIVIHWCHFFIFISHDFQHVWINMLCDDILLVGGVTSMDPFLKKFFPQVYDKEHGITVSKNKYCKFDSQILTLFTSSLYFAALVSSLLSSIFTRVLGRRVTMLAGGIFFLLGAFLNGFAKAVWMLIVGRLLLGFGIGCANQALLPS